MFVVLGVAGARIAMLIMRNVSKGSSRKTSAEVLFWAVMILVGLVATFQFSSCCEVSGC